MDHVGAAELLAAYALRALPADERQAIDVHVQDCPECRAQLDDFLRAAAELAAGRTLVFDDAALDRAWKRVVNRLR